MRDKQSGGSAPVPPKGGTRARTLERFSRALDLPADIVAGLPRIQIVGNNEVIIENHKGVLLYNDTDIHINGGGVIIKLHGDGLSITAMNATELAVRGKLLGVDFVY